MDADTLNYHRLNKALIHPLLDDETMGASEFNGFCAGLALTPAHIAPEDWLGEVADFSALKAEAPEAYEDLAQQLTLHAKMVKIVCLSADGFMPLLEVSTLGGREESMWPIWVSGLHRAYRLRPQSWRVYDGKDMGVRQAKRDLLRLCDYVDRAGAAPPPMAEELDDAPNEILSDLVMMLHDARLAAADVGRKIVGRNDPCLCGSGKKYKKCCLT